MSWSPTHVVVAASALLVSLAGCSHATAPAPGLTSDEYARNIRHKNDVYRNCAPMPRGYDYAFEL